MASEPNDIVRADLDGWIERNSDIASDAAVEAWENARDGLR